MRCAGLINSYHKHLPAVIAAQEGHTDTECKGSHTIANRYEILDIYNKWQSIIFLTHLFNYVLFLYFSTCVKIWCFGSYLYGNTENSVSKESFTVTISFSVGLFWLFLSTASSTTKATLGPRVLPTLPQKCKLLLWLGRFHARKHGTLQLYFVKTDAFCFCL